MRQKHLGTVARHVPLKDIERLSSRQRDRGNRSRSRAKRDSAADRVADYYRPE